MAKRRSCRDRILCAAVALADRGGVHSLSMRKVAQELDMVPMALYRHVANKDEMLDGMVDVVVGEIDPPETGLDRQTTMRLRILSARRMLLRHPLGGPGDRDADRSHARRDSGTSTR